MKPCVKKRRNKSTGSPVTNSLHFPKTTAAPFKRELLFYLLTGEIGDMAAKTPRLIKPERCDHKWDYSIWVDV
jgi:hypothetical protein